MLLMLSVHPIVGWRVWAYIPKAHAGRAGAVEISSIGLAGQRNVLSFDRPPLSSLEDMAISSAMSLQEPAAKAPPAEDTKAKMTVAASRPQAGVR